MNREHELAADVIDTLLRENYAGLSGWVRPGPVLELPGSGGRTMPLAPDGFLADLRLARPDGAAPAMTLGDVDAVVAAIGDPLDSGGASAFSAECRQALATLRQHDRELPARPAAALAPGLLGAIQYDALAATRPHPAYPTWACRLGLSEQDTRRHAAEFRPEFELRWMAVPRALVVRSGNGLPRWWPAMADVGLPPALTGTHELMPVHPLTARAGLAAGELAPAPFLRVRPTLSMRTVAITEHPGCHLKLPVPVSTLGFRNRRAIKPGTLADGALVYQILAEATAHDENLRGLLLTDETAYAHAGHPYLGYLLRRLPPDLDQCRIIPVAALLAVYADLAVSFRDYLDLVFGIAMHLFVRYGIALESHQQNAALVAGAGLRLLVKDFDGALISHARLTRGLGTRAPGACQFSDPRLLTESDDALADVFITITVHLCAGAIAFGLARQARAPLGDLLSTVREALSAALDRYGDDRAAALLRARVLDADRLPGKAMVTAGTLMDKARTGATDINKYYGTSGPNYLRAAG